MGNRGPVVAAFTPAQMMQGAHFGSSFYHPSGQPSSANDTPPQSHRVPTIAASLSFALGAASSSNAVHTTRTSTVAEVEEGIHRGNIKSPGGGGDEEDDMDEFDEEAMDDYGRGGGARPTADLRRNFDDNIGHY
uniref:Uncharacterized protein n=1 Tax=Globodera rostochiensis TaxID=31243 RepID=A0A914GRG6_GLORO